MHLEKSLCFVNFDGDLNRISRNNKELNNQLSKNFKKIYILNLNNLRYFYGKNNYPAKNDLKLIPKNFEMVNIKTSDDFIKFSKNKKLFIVINGISKSIIDFKIFYLFKKVKARLIMLSITGQYGTKIFTDIKLKNIFVAHKHVLIKSFYYIWRILTILNIFPKIHILFESSAENIKIFNNGISRKFENYFPVFKISLYRKIIHTNSKVFDTVHNKLTNSRKKNNNKYILYIDSPIVSEGRIQREGYVGPDIKKKYYKNLFSALNYLSIIFKKKIIVSLHPSSIKSFGKIKKSFKEKSKNILVSKKRTADLLQDSSIVLFSISSAILSAVIMKKKIIALKSKYFGEYNLKINEKNVRGLKCPVIDIDSKIEISKKELEKEFIKSISSFNNLIKKRLTNNSETPSYVEIVETLKKEMT